MADNLQITRVEKNRNGDGTSVYYTFAFPVTQDNMDGYVVLDNGTYLAAMREGTIEDPNMGLYSACMNKIVSDITPYLTITDSKNGVNTDTTDTKEA